MIPVRTSNATIRNSRNALIILGQLIPQHATARKLRAARGISATKSIAKKSEVATSIRIATADKNAPMASVFLRVQEQHVRKQNPFAMPVLHLQTGTLADARKLRAAKDMNALRAIAVSVRRKHAKPTTIVRRKRNVPTGIASSVMQSNISQRKSG